MRGEGLFVVVVVLLLFLKIIKKCNPLQCAWQFKCEYIRCATHEKVHYKFTDDVGPDQCAHLCSVIWAFSVRDLYYSIH